MKSYLDSNQLRNRLKLKSFQSERKLLESHSLAKEFFEGFKLRPGKIRQHATNLLASGLLASNLLLASTTNTPAPTPTTTESKISVTNLQVIRQQLVELMATVLPDNIQTLGPDQEKKISSFLFDIYGLKTAASFEGNKLNDSYGQMGAEQHLARFPGDQVENMAPGLGGWGYVSDPEVEKYYVAVQTLYLPNWKTETEKLSKWYKFRRVVVVNPANGKTIIASIADAGPADWTGKKFGGSPEVMAYLGIDYGMQNHPVVLFFLDDANNQIPLGPVEYNVNDLWQLKSFTTI